MHVRTDRAAVAVTFGGSDTAEFASPLRPPPRRPPFVTLWASRALDLRLGRLIGVRIGEHRIDVALVAPGSDSMRWVDAEGVLTESQARLWLRTSTFTMR